MADPQEFNSLDELFRKTFDDLPDTAAPSGWDTPSPQVWDQVQVRLKPPRSGWSTQTILLVSSLAITLMLGLYWALSSPETPASAAPAAVDSTEQSTASAPLQTTDNLVNELPANAATTTRNDDSRAHAGVEKPRSTTRRRSPVSTQRAEKSSTPAAPNSTEKLSEEPRRAHPGGSVPLPGSRPASPNTTVQKQAEQWRGAPWAKPLAPLPGTLETQYIRPVPESLKNLFNPGKKE